MPINVANALPAAKILEAENIFLITETRACHQDIRPLRILIVNLMPKKIETETQLLRVLSNTPLQVDVELLQMQSHISKNTSAEHLLKFYQFFDDIRDERFDGLIITGAPVEHMEFEDVDYWEELCQIMEWSNTHVYSTLHICWGAQAGLYYHYGIPKHPLPEKMFGIFPQQVYHPTHELLRGFDETFMVPQSRHTEVRAEDIKKHSQLEILAASSISGPHIIAGREKRRFFVTGHSEYDRETLAAEYFRDLERGLPISVPVNYFPNDDPTKRPFFNWRAHANLFFSNWLNYFVYQKTPFNLEHLQKPDADESV